MKKMEVLEYPFNAIQAIFGAQKEITGDKEVLTKMMDEAFEKLKELPDEAELEENWEEVEELVLSKCIPMAVDFYKNGKSVEEIAQDMGVSEKVVHHGLSKVLRKLRHPQISKPIHRNIVFESDEEIKRESEMKTKIYETLDYSFERAKKDLKHKEIDLCNAIFAPNVFFESNDTDSLNGFVEEWAKENNVNLFVVTENGYEIKCATAVVSIDFLTESYIMPTKEQIEKLNQPNTVLFLKNIDKMQDKSYRRKLLDFMRSFIVADESKEESYTFVKNMLFTVATISEMKNSEFFELDTMDAKDAFYCIKVD